VCKAEVEVEVEVEAGKQRLTPAIRKGHEGPRYRQENN
jgi:hypothetical protein